MSSSPDRPDQTAPDPADPMAPAAPAAEEPVIVVGAGPVGLVTALLLARFGVPSVVLEAAARRDPAGSRAICFQRDVLDVLDRVGCAAELVAAGVTWTTGRTYYRDHELFTVEFPSPTGSHEEHMPPWINISQAVVEEHLVRLAAAEPLIELRYGHRAVALCQDARGIAVEVAPPGRGEDGAGGPPGGTADCGGSAGGGAADGSSSADGSGSADGGGSAGGAGGLVRVRGSHLVGADGARSTVRRLLGIDFPGRSFADKFLICDIRADLPFPSERRFYFDPAWNPGRQVLVHHCPDSTWRIDWQVPAGYDLAAERASGALDARVRQITGDVPYEIVWASAYTFHERCAEALRAGRAFLAGDAAHLYAPFGARGLNSGIQDAENLAWKLAFARRGWAGPGLLDSYQAERLPAARENLRVTTATMEFLVPRTAEQRARRLAALEAALADPDARGAVDSGKLAEPYYYLDSPLTSSAGPPADFPYEPGASRPPVPGVLCPDGPCVVDGRPTRLRRLFGTGLVVLTATAEQAVLADRAATGTGAPTAVHALDTIDPSGELRRVLRAGPQSTFVIRPDGHIAAVLNPGPNSPAHPVTERVADPTAELAAALRRATGHGQPGSLSP